MNLESAWAWGLTAANAGASTLPTSGRYALAGALGKSVSRLFAAKRVAVEKNLEHINAFCKTRFSASTVFRNFGYMLADFLGGQKVSVTVEGRDRAEAVRALGRGSVILTTHLGNWELGGRVVAGWGWPVTAVYQPYRSETMQRFIQTRRPQELRYLAVGKGAAHGIVKTLRRRESVAMLADRPFGEDGGWVNVCGKPMRFPQGPFLFAVRSSVPVLPGFALMVRPGVYKVVLEEPLWPEGPDPVQNLMDKMAQLLGKYIASHGDQWYCFEPAWPNTPGDLDSFGRSEVSGL